MVYQGLSEVSMAAVDHPPQEKVDEQVKIQLPAFV